MKYAIFICTHGRPDNQLTLKLLREAGCDGQIYLVLDNEDETGSQYLKYKNANTDIVVFDKQEWIDKSETGTTEEHRKSILYAKNFCEYLAIDIMKLDAFIVADDDIMRFRYSGICDINYTLQEWLNFCMAFMVSCDVAMMGFLPNVLDIYSTMLSFTPIAVQMYRFPYNFIFRNAKYNKFIWHSWIGQDTMVCIDYANRGYKILSIPFTQQQVPEVGSNGGGMIDTYTSTTQLQRSLHKMKYYPCAYTMCEDADTLKMKIDTNKLVPAIISLRYKK